MVRVIASIVLAALTTLAGAQETPESYAAAAKRRYEKGDLEGAKLGYDKAISLAQTRPAYYYERGKIKMDLGKIHHAIIDLRIATVFHDEFTEAWQLLGIANYRIANYSEAHRCLYLSIVLDNDNAKSWLWCGIVSQKLGDDLNAIDFIKKSLEYEPESALAWYHYGLSLSAERKPILAADKLTKAIELRADDAAFYHARAISYAQQALSDQNPTAFFTAAEKDLKTVQELHPDFNQNEVGWAIVEFLRGDRDKAMDYLQQKMKRDNGLETRLRIWALLRLAGKDEQADEILRSTKEESDSREFQRLRDYLIGERKVEELRDDLQDIELLTQRWFCMGIKELGKDDNRNAILHLELCSIRPNSFESLVARKLLQDLQAKKTEK